jgi:integrase
VAAAKEFRAMPNLASDLSQNTPSLEQQRADHDRIVQGYLDTHWTRNHTEKTLLTEKRFLERWFNTHAPDDRDGPLFVWDAMVPILGRERVIAYVKGLVAQGRQKSSTILGKVGILRRFFSYVLEWPYIPGSTGVSIQARYGPIDQPVLSYDYPTHALNERVEDAPLTRNELQSFYRVLHKRVQEMKRRRAVTLGRNYTLFVLAGESGLRIQEILKLEIERDLLFVSSRLQTRAGKGYRGSGPRVRQTVFTPFAQATIRYYLEQIRPSFKRWSQLPQVFLSERGRGLELSSAQQVMRNVKTVGREAGLRIPPRFGWHSLRRSYATTFMEETPESPWVLMEMLGHSNPSTLTHYVYHPRAYHEKVMDGVIEKLIRS